MVRAIFAFLGGACLGAFTTLEGISETIDMIRLFILILGVHLTIWSYRK